MENNNTVEDAEIIDTSKKVVPKGKVLIVYQEGDKIVPGGTEFDLDESGMLCPNQALGFIRAFSASKLPDGHTLIVTAHLRNGETMSEVYESGPSEKYDENVGIEFCKGKLMHRVWKLLQSIFAMATYTEEKNKADDAASEKAEQEA